ncbi:hypothetical protein ACLKA6_012199 [Drosophila palustris]
MDMTLIELAVSSARAVESPIIERSSVAIGEPDNIWICEQSKQAKENEQREKGDKAMASRPGRELDKHSMSMSLLLTLRSSISTTS